MKSPVAPLLAAIAIHISAEFAPAQELKPDDPSIASDLRLWLRDAANTFDETTGTWADSSGNGKDAVTVGEVNVNAPQTFEAPTLVTTPGGSFSVDEIPAVHFAADVNDLLATEGLNEGVGFENLTIFVAYNITNLGGNPNLTRTVGIGSVAATQANPGNHVNLSSDPSIRKDNGQLGSGQYSQAFPAEMLFIRSVRLSPAAIDDWFNTDGTPAKVFSVEGSSYVTSVDAFYLGDLRCGTDTVPGFGGATAPSDFDIVQVLVYGAALSDDQIGGVNEWLTNNLSSAAPGGGLRITDVIYDAGSGSSTITWASKPGRTYAVDASDDLANWGELDDGIESEGEETSFTEEGIAGIRERFYRVREL